MNASVQELVDEVPNPPQDLITTERRDLETVRRWLDWILAGVDRLNTRFFIDSTALPLVRELVLQNGFLACVYSWHGGAEIGKASLVHTWIDSSVFAGLDEELLRNVRNLWVHEIPKSKFHLTSADSEMLAIFNAAVAERLLAERAAWQGRQAVRDLMVRLGLGAEEVAAMLHVPVETLTGWESGLAAIPADKAAQLQAATRALSKLLGIFRPDRLPQVIRRRVELFEGQSAAEWIISGKITEVAERYETAFAYQA
jgi:DNA-binding transcriptional regulator YiaG